MTASRFLPDAFIGSAGKRLYRTGDWARYLKDGRIVFHGRLDHQIKMRGYRIELGEIETVLAEYPGVRQAVVTTREREHFHKVLVAYIVPQNRGANDKDPPRPSPEGLDSEYDRTDDGSGRRESSTEAISERTLREYAEGRLPNYLVPSVFVFLDEIPRTASGKIDRVNLPSAGAHQREAAAVVVPRNSLEKSIARIWQEFFGLQRVSMQSNFFELGGHSLLVMRLQSELQRCLGLRVNVVELFRYPTIRRLADYVLDSGSSFAQQTEGLHRARIRQETAVHRNGRGNRLDRFETENA
jgi:acyl carrier protein